MLGVLLKTVYSILSFSGLLFSSSTDQMSFTQRVSNFIALNFEGMFVGSFFYKSFETAIQKQCPEFNMDVSISQSASTYPNFNLVDL